MTIDPKQPEIKVKDIVFDFYDVKKPSIPRGYARHVAGADIVIVGGVVVKIKGDINEYSFHENCRVLVFP